MISCLLVSEVAATTAALLSDLGHILLSFDTKLHQTLNSSHVFNSRWDYGHVTIIWSHFQTEFMRKLFVIESHFLFQPLRIVRLC